MGLSDETKKNRWNLLKTKLEEHSKQAFSRWIEDDFSTAQDYLAEDVLLRDGRDIEIKLSGEGLTNAVVLRGKITVEPR